MGKNVTDEQIKALAREAAEAGDRKMVAICKRALGRRPKDADPLARAECAKVIAENEAQT